MTLQRFALATSLAFLAMATAQAAPTQVGSTNEFLLSGGGVSFSLSLVPTSPADGLLALPAMEPSKTQGLQPSYALRDPGGTFYFRSSYDTGWGGSFAGAYPMGSGGGVSPVGADGAPYPGTYIAVGNGPSSGGAASIQNSFTIAPNGGSLGNAKLRHMSLLWGSVEASNRLNLGATGWTITGADILAAAQSLGIAGGNRGSFYVSINALNGHTFSYVNTASGGLSTTMEYVILGVSRTGNYYPASVSAAPGFEGTPVEAPAPTLGATPLGTLLALSLIAWGLRAGRVRHASSGMSRLAA